MWEWHISTQQPARKQIQINDKRFPCLSPPSAPPSIGSLWSTNVTGTSFSVCWSNHAETKQTYLVVLRKGSEVIQTQKISDTTIEVSGLKPGLLYNVTVTPRACGNQGAPLYISVKTCKYIEHKYERQSTRELPIYVTAPVTFSTALPLFITVMQSYCCYG